MTIACLYVHRPLINLAAHNELDGYFRQLECCGFHRCIALAGMLVSIHFGYAASPSVVLQPDDKCA